MKPSKPFESEIVHSTMPIITNCEKGKRLRSVCMSCKVLGCDVRKLWVREESNLQRRQ